jgi:hypothetical protein
LHTQLKLSLPGKTLGMRIFRTTSRGNEINLYKLFQEKVLQILYKICLKESHFIIQILELKTVT